MIDAFGLQDHRSNVEAGEGVKVLMPIWFVPGRVSASESHDACARSVPKRKHFSSKEEQDKASCAHVCSIQEVETAIQTNVFKSEACGWTSKKYACMRDGETLSQSLGRLLFEPASGTVALAATQTSTAGGKLGVCGWQEHSGVYCCANTVPVKADAKSHDSGQEEEVPENPFTGGGERIIAECPGIMSDKNFRPAPASGDEDTEGAGDEDWEKVMKMDPNAALKQAKQEQKNKATEDIVAATNGVAAEIEKNSLDGEFLKAIAESEGAADGGATGGGAMRGATGGGATGGGATGGATGGAAVLSSGTGGATGGAFRRRLRRRR